MTTEYGMWIQGDCQILLALRTSQLLINTRDLAGNIPSALRYRYLSDIGCSGATGGNRSCWFTENIAGRPFINFENRAWILDSGRLSNVGCSGRPCRLEHLLKHTTRYVVGSLQHNCQGLLPFRSPWQFWYNNLIVLIWLNNCCNFRAIESALFSTVSVS